MDEPPSKPLIGVVGPCGSGKSTLIAGLEAQGYPCRHIAQEHSHVPAMWQVIANPDILIYLQASFSTCTVRHNLNWQPTDYAEQLRRLAHARTHAQLIIDTDSLTPNQILQIVIDFIKDSVA